MEVGARLVRKAQMRFLTGTKKPEEARTWLQVEQRSGISADTLASSTKVSLSCTAEPVSKLVMSDTGEVLRSDRQ